VCTGQTKICNEIWNGMSKIIIKLCSVRDRVSHPYKTRRIM